MKILVADDNAQNRYLLEKLLQSAGYACVTTADGREALARLRAERFDAIVSDVLMPGMDGFQLCREVKQDPALRNLPFVFFTATYTDPKDAELGQRLGADRYINKPAEPEHFLSTLADVLRAPRDLTEPPPADADDVYLQQYNARLVQKLEKKMLELERAHGEVLRANVALRDEIGRRQQAEESLRQSLALLQATLDSTADGILSLDAAGNVTGCNRQFLAMWRIAGQTPPGHLDRLLPVLLAQVRAPATFEEPIRGSLRDLRAPAADTVELVDGRIVERVSLPQRADAPEAGRVWSFRDITEREQAEEARRKLQDQLFQSQKMEALGILAGGIAHDFNNLLTAILGQTGLAATYLDAKHPATESLEAIEAAGTRAAELVRQILTFSRNQAPARKVMTLPTVVQGVLKLIRATLPPSIALEADLPENLPPVKADPTQVHQVLMNLASNASYAMRGKGTITFTLRSVHFETETERPAPELKPGAYLCLCVSDAGSGMDETTLRHVFEPFFTTKPPGEGTGLGLAVVHGIMKAHEGSIAVESVPGKGTAFRLYFPVSDGAAAPELARPASLRRGQGELILLVDDEPGVLAFIARLLRMIAYRVEAYERADLALRRFEEGAAEFSLVITDLAMPGMSGTEFVERVRALRPEMPVIVTTGYLSDSGTERQRVAPRCEVLLKPCTAEQLSELVRRLLTTPGA